MTVRELNDLFNRDSNGVIICEWEDGKRNNVIIWQGTAGELWYSEFIDCTVSDLDICVLTNRFIVSIPKREVTERLVKEDIDDAVLGIFMKMQTRHGDTSPEQDRKLKNLVERLARCMTEIIMNGED